MPKLKEKGKYIDISTLSREQLEDLVGVAWKWKYGDEVGQEGPPPGVQGMDVGPASGPTPAMPGDQEIEGMYQQALLQSGIGKQQVDELKGRLGTGLEKIKWSY